MTWQQTVLVQQFLAGQGLYKGKIDGLAGPMTTTGVRLFQRSTLDLKVDGIVGPKTWAAMFPGVPAPLPEPQQGAFYIGDAKRLEPGDIERVAADIQVEARALKAVVRVEASGSGFDIKGRVKCLFEPHVCYRMAPPNLRDALAAVTLPIHAGEIKVAYVKWGTRRYPSSSDTRIAQVDKVTEMAGPELAADSASWGIAQIMGFNAQSCGYMTAVDMVRAFAIDEENQLAAMGAFILNNAACHRALQRRDWPAFAEIYNGKGFREHGYHLKLASAYDDQH